MLLLLVCDMSNWPALLAKLSCSAAKPQHTVVLPPGNIAAAAQPATGASSLSRFVRMQPAAGRCNAWHVVAAALRIHCHIMFQALAAQARDCICEVMFAIQTWAM